MSAERTQGRRLRVAATIEIPGEVAIVGDGGTPPPDTVCLHGGIAPGVAITINDRRLGELVRIVRVDVNEVYADGERPVDTIVDATVLDVYLDL